MGTGVSQEVFPNGRSQASNLGHRGKTVLKTCHLAVTGGSALPSYTASAYYFLTREKTGWGRWYLPQDCHTSDEFVDILV